MKPIELKVRKSKLEQFVYVPLNVDGIEAGDEVIVEFWCRGKMIKKTRYTVREKVVKGKYVYKYLLIRLPYFTTIRDAIKSGWKPYFDLKIRIYPDPSNRHLQRSESSTPTPAAPRRPL
jgi:hypothetical protein